MGEGLALTLGGLATDPARSPRETWFLTDRNGEALRANDWASASSA